MDLSLKADLSGQVAVVTGSSQGLGKAVALALGSNGAHVVCLARSADKLAETVSQIDAAGGSAQAVACDVTDRAAAAAAIAAVHEQRGRLDILVNNAGITRDKLMRGMSDEEWDDVITTNLTSCFVCCRAAANLMRRASMGGSLTWRVFQG